MLTQILYKLGIFTFVTTIKRIMNLFKDEKKLNEEVKKVIDSFIKYCNSSGENPDKEPTDKDSLKYDEEQSSDSFIQFIFLSNIFRLKWDINPFIREAKLITYIRVYSQEDPFFEPPTYEPIPSISVIVSSDETIQFEDVSTRKQQGSSYIVDFNEAYTNVLQYSLKELKKVEEKAKKDT